MEWVKQSGTRVQRKSFCVCNDPINTHDILEGAYTGSAIVVLLGGMVKQRLAVESKLE